MTRRGCLAFPAILAGCGGRAPRRRNLLPEAVAGEWRRTGLRDLPAAAASDVIAGRVVRRIQGAVYEGPGKLDVTAYELTSSAAALDAVQRWRPAAGTVFFYQDEFFIVVKYREADRKALNGFVRELIQSLKAS